MVSGRRAAVVGINFPPELTGIAPYNAAIATALHRAGAAVRVITGVPHYPEWRIAAPYDRGWRHDEHVDGLAISRLRHWVPRHGGLVERAVMEATFLLHALPVVWRSRPDAIVAITPSLSGVAAATFGRRNRPLGVVVQDFTGDAAAQTGAAGKHVAQAIINAERALLRRADLVGVIAPDFADQLIAMGVAGDRIVVLPNFTHIEPIDISAPNARTRLGWEQDVFTVVHTGNMGMKQDLGNVIEAAHLAEEQSLPIRWVLVGDGNQRANLEAQAAGLTSVRFVPPLPTDEYPLSLAAADVLLVNEGAGVDEFCLPSKITSYAVAGRPVVAAVRHGGITDRTLATARMAVAAAAGQPAALLAAVRRVMDEPTLRRDLVAAAGEYAHTISREAAEARYIDFVARLLERR